MSTRSSMREADETWALRALALAGRGVALTHPNPTVGAVIVRNGRIVGEGFHQYEKLDHAEVVALKQAGPKARGATLYVTLEPCCHRGRTAACTDAIIAAGIRRVVAAMPDPNRVVTRKGFAQLRRAGIRVDVGACAGEARRLNEGFAKWIGTGRPFVTLKAALTLDGRIALRPGHSTSISSEPSRAAVQRLRHEADALVTGIGTVLADDPLLTDRSGQPRRRKLLRAVLDSRLRLPLKSRLVESARNDAIVFTTLPTDSLKARALTRAGVEVLRVAAKRGRVDLNAALRELGRREILTVLLEAGAELNGAALDAGIVDKMILFYAPRIMGNGGVPMAQLSSRGFDKLRPLCDVALSSSGSDFVVQGYLHDVYRNHRSRRGD
ncbi:MAG TPA: bifunctional diaminohydroxyphosphoribosylaminopyrimidine deaminase/5-amino-6-(5-phosphoribosylamino)uracil reductase RibD [Candidatus Acidoferrales bacterium]|nr:bifunctional diaminohydroxyphosphoribosylaminopyrimidine deaminase/5-amino-6-(5-phosphoribosylamino)uracil reductase RibD [Candidatus Acidoferrales bacterium]